MSIFSRGRGLAGFLAAVAMILAAPQIAAAQAGPSLHGMILGRDGPNMIVRNNDGTETTVTLTENTKVIATEGALGIRQSELAVTDLLDGLPVTVETVHNGQALDAVRVTFKVGDLKTARQVEAGTAQAKARVKAKAAELEAQNQELRRRMSEANQYVEKGSATILFPVGSATISKEGKAQLKGLAQQAKAIKGYLIGVIGHADTTGSSEANQALSEKRANAVIRYLQKYCGIQPYRVLAQNAMGEAHQVGASETAEGRAQNRRVVVQILVNKGLEGL